MATPEQIPTLGPIARYEESIIEQIKQPTA